MPAFEYQVVPAPRKGKPGRGIKGAQAKFANAITALMNEMGSQGWEYMRADTLPCEERQGLTSKTVKYHSMLVFRRAVGAQGADSSDATMLALEHYEDKLEDYADLDEPASEPHQIAEHASEFAEAAPEDIPENAEANDQARA